MRHNQMRKSALENNGVITWGAVAGTVDHKTGVVDYRNLPDRAYPTPANEVEEQAACDRIMAAAEKRLRKRKRNMGEE